jgi:putative alpha-1,2-mannosidase
VSISGTSGDIAFSLSADPNAVWGTAETSAPPPPSFGAAGPASDR